MTPVGPPFRVWRFARKELREILRDRRTIVTLVLMPVLLYPVLSIAFYQYFINVEQPKETNEYRIVASSDADGAQIEKAFASMPQQNKDVKFEWYAAPDPESELRKGNAHIAMRVVNFEQFAHIFDNSVLPEFEITVVEDSAIGKKVAGIVTSGLTDVNIRTMETVLEQGGLKRFAPAYHAKVREIPQTEGKKSTLFSSLIPLILVLMTITGAVYPAIDLTAGERERGTLEILMAAPIPRVGLLLAKYIAVLTVTILTGLVNLTSMTVTIWVSGLGKVLFGEGGLTVASALGVLGLLLLMAMFFSAVLLAVTSFARSFKEAQAYLIPLMLASITPGMIALLPGMSLGGLTTVTPLLNVVLLAKELFEGGVPPANAVIVVLSTLIYAFCAIALAARVFGAEAVLYSEQGQIGDVFRRQRQPRAEATLTAALFCLALVFAAQFMLSGLSTKLRLDLAVEVRLLISMTIGVGLFLGFPLVWSWFGRVDLYSGWQLRRAPLLAFPAAILMGLSLWPFAAEAQVLLQKAGITSLPKSLEELIRPTIDRWRGTSPALVLLAMAVTPAIVEEVFFRGFLFNAFPHREYPWRTIMATSLLFGAFHILMFNILVLERLVPATLLGIALGWLRWRSGSVFPGMLLHVTNNAFLMLIALYPSWSVFQPIAEASSGSEHVPITWLAASLPIAAAGIALAWFARRKFLAA